MTSGLTVHHKKQTNEYTLQPVEPDDGETWYILATWSTDESPLSLGCECVNYNQAAVNATVTWSDATGWSVTCTGCNPLSGPIRSVSVCPVDGCGTGDDIDNAWAYKLLVDVNSVGPYNYFCVPDNAYYPTYLQNVAYTTTSVDNGNLVDDTNCTEGPAVSPTNQTWNVTDTGGFECGVSCDSNVPSTSIRYQ